MISLTTWAFFQAGRKEPEDTFLAPKAEELPRPPPAEVCGNSGCWTVASNTMQYMLTMIMIIMIRVLLLVLLCTRFIIFVARVYVDI